MIYNIWMSGFMIQGMDSPAQANFYGTIEADSFQEACDKLAAQKKDILYNPKNRSSWGCGLYETEQEARKSFG